MNQNSKTVLITGVLGFIGGHTAKAFKKAGYRVVGIDREWTIAEGAKFVDQLFISDFVNLAAFAAKNENVDAIVHCAGTSLVGPSIDNPSEYYDNNVFKTNTMLSDLAKNDWHGTIVFSSSAAVYGNNYTRPWLEQDLKNPISPYGRSKLMCEQVIEDHCHAYGFKGIALRYFNACGCDPDGELGNVWNDTHLVPRVVQSVIENTALIINGNDFDTPDGTCIRDYLHVTDLANAHLRAVELSSSMSNREFRCYNLGTGVGSSNAEIVQQVTLTTEIPVDFKFGSRRAGDPAELVADPGKFMQDTAWMPEYSNLKTIVDTTYQWMSRLFNKTQWQDRAAEIW